MGVILIGYGNELRGDDAVGPRIARIVAGWGIEEVDARTCHQLLPELAESLSRKEYAVFVDASLDSTAKGVSVETVIASGSNAVDGHLSNPASLLALSQALYGRTAQAWLVRVPVEQCDLGADLSASAQIGMDAALTRIRQLLNDLTQKTASRHA